MITLASFYKKLRPKDLGKILNFWPPYIGAGIKIVDIKNDWSRVEVVLKLKWYNRNYVGTHYGGNLFSMADPFYMIMLMQKLGREYMVWDKSASIEFIRPGKGEVHAVFLLEEDEVENMREEVRQKGRAEFKKSVEIKNKSDELVARVTKTISIKPKIT